MQSIAPERRNLVSISSTGSVRVGPATNASQTQGSANAREAAAAGNVLNEIIEAFGDLFNATVQPSAMSRQPSLFSGAAPSPGETINAILSALSDICEKLSAASSGSSTSAMPPSAPAAAPAATAPTPQLDPNWPYPDLGPSPFVERPTGSGPTGTFGFNPTYFPTRETAEKIAQMVGGKVVAQNAMLTAPGSPFVQDQPNYLVEMPNGNVFNPGFIAQAISVKQPRAMIDAMIYSDINNVEVPAGQAPPFVPVNASTSSTPAAPASPSTATPAPSAIDQLSTHLYGSSGSGAAADKAAGTVRDQMQSVQRMLQLLTRIASLRPAQPESFGRRSIG